MRLQNAVCCSDHLNGPHRASQSHCCTDAEALATLAQDLRSANSVLASELLRLQGTSQEVGL